MTPNRLIRRVAAALIVAVAVVAAAAAQSPRSFLWKVESGGRVLYLAGSVHALSSDMYPLSPAFDRAFDASGTLVEEIDLSEADSMAAMPMLMAKGVYRDGRTFDQVVSKETAALVAERLKAVPGIQELIRPMKPWVVTLMLTALQMQTSGLDATLGLDKHYFDKAKSAGKPVVGLETTEYQIDRFDQMPDALQEQMLRATLNDVNTGDAELKAILAAWKRGDAAGIEQQLLGGFGSLPGAYRSLIVERNQNWLPQIDACLARTSPCFVIVGAAHLVGPDGLLKMLEKKGYRLEQQ
jgi:uncharacterized protein YbaP (TraB family)